MKYRAEIDGLRAIAVLSVILYHIEFFFLESKILAGGFVGVDIFFVISGYLITSIIIKEIDLSNKFSLIKSSGKSLFCIIPPTLPAARITISGSNS